MFIEKIKILCNKYIKKVISGYCYNVEYVYLKAF